MSEQAKSSHDLQRLPAPLTAEEFDERFDAGEDMSPYLDWDKAVLVLPGELSPGQRESLLVMFGELSTEQQVLLLQQMLDSIQSEEAKLNLPLPVHLHSKLSRAALRHQSDYSSLAHSWLTERLNQEPALK